MKIYLSRVQLSQAPLTIYSIILSATLGLGVFLSSLHVSADNDSVVDKINIKVPVSCTLSGTGMDTHNAEINNGQYNSNIGETTMKAFCNDNEGFAIYAIGYTDNANGKNVLTNSTLGSTHDIVTGTAISGSTSNWAMKLNTNSDPIPTYPITIENSFDSFHAVPDTYTLVAKRASGTDIGESAEGSTIQSTYQAYISPVQAAGTYTGQVKYTLVHPHDEPTPPDSMLDIGANVGIKIKNLSEGITNATRSMQTTKIKAIKTATELPTDFVPSEANTVSVPDSKHPIYIFFDNTNDAGIMYFYTDGDRIVMNPDSSQIFRNHTNLTDISGLLDWDASRVTTLSVAFYGDSSLTTLHGLENWDVSRVTNFYSLFRVDTSLSDLSALSDWNTGSVINLSQAFALGTTSHLLSLHGLENWNTGNVENMEGTFATNPSLIDIAALSGWDTGKVTNMGGLFYRATSLVNISDILSWDTSNVQNMNRMFHQCSSLFSIGSNSWDTSSVTDMSSMFLDADSLTDVSGITKWDTANVRDMSWMFAGARSLETIDVSRWNTRNVRNMVEMFKYDSSLRTLNITGWDTSNVIDMTGMFNVGDSYIGNGQLQEIIGLENLDVSNVTNMTGMFYGAGQMTHYDIANWNVSKVESFNHMFTDNFKLESLDLSRWDVSSVKTMHNMFDDDRALTTIGDVSHWNTASLIDVGGWLNGATSFVGNNGTLDLSGWNTTNLKAAEEMFRAVKLRIIDLSGWTFDSITNDGWEGAGSGGIYYSYGTGLDVMFKDTAQLNAVYVSQSGLDSFNTAVNNGIDTTNMWSGSGVSGFTVK